MKEALKFIDKCSVPSQIAKRVYGINTEIISKKDAKQAVRMVNKWISVKDEFPDNSTRVIASSDWIGEVTYKDGTWIFGEGYESGLMDNVTHWMPLPEKHK